MQVLTPGVQHGEEADGSTEVPGIGRKIDCSVSAVARTKIHTSGVCSVGPGWPGALAA